MTSLWQHYSLINYTNDLINENEIILASIEEVELPLMTLLKQGYTYFLYNNDLINNMNDKLINNINAEYIDGEDNDLFRDFINNEDDGHFDNAFDNGTVCMMNV